MKVELKRLLVALCWLGLGLGSVMGQGKIYFVLGSDTAFWNYPTNAPNTVDTYHMSSYYNTGMLTKTNQPGFQVMNPAWRSQFVDSFGQTIKFTWWMMGGNVFRYAPNLNVPIPNTMTLYLMKKYHGDAIRQFGDELSLHYHTFLWSDYNGDGKWYWNQSRTFLECKDDFDYTVGQFLLEEEVFPVTFRSGWHFMDNDWQNYLDLLLPYSLHNDYGVKKTWAQASTTEPITGVEDWSRATTNFIPFHPATNDYQVPGNGRGWETRSVKMQNTTSNTIYAIFFAASRGSNEVPCIWTHLPENFASQVLKVDGYIHRVAAQFPGIEWRYCTATEAMQRYLEVTDTTPPNLLVVEDLQGQTLTLTLITDEPIWQPQPFVSVKDIYQQYSILNCTNIGENSWQVTVPVPRNRLAKIGIAVTDLAGNLTKRILRYVPDDIYIDNLDAQYAEVQGAWKTTNNAAWGNDARAAQLAEDNTVQVQWSLPITQAGRYALSLQVSNLNNAASNLFFNVYADGANIYSAFTTNRLPSGQWLLLGAPYLDPAASNVLEMVVSGTNQPGTWVEADVLKIAFLPDTNAPALVCPSDMVVACVGSGGMLVEFAVTATDDVDANPVVVCTPPSGSIFLPGVTTVFCTATDSNANESSCTFTVNAVAATLPVLTQEPESRTNLLGADASFSAATSGCGPLSYQWLFGESALLDETNAVLIVTNVQLSQAGQYAVVVANSAGAVTSAVAVLTVNRAPVAFPRGFATSRNTPLILAISNILGNDFDPDGDPLKFTVAALTAQGGSTAFGTNDVVAYLPPADFTGVDSFNYFVSDGRGGAATSTVEVVVMTGPVPLPNQMVLMPGTNGLTIRFGCIAGATYAVERSTDLKNWSEIYNTVIPVQPLYGLLDFQDSDAPPDNAFYRMRYLAGPPVPPPHRQVSKFSH